MDASAPARTIPPAIPPLDLRPSWLTGAPIARALHDLAGDRPESSLAAMRGLASEAIQRRRATGAIVLAWTVRSPEHEAWARRFADNVIFEGYVPEAAALGHRLSSPGSGASASR
jgi:hypothetical protein